MFHFKAKGTQNVYSSVDESDNDLDSNTQSPELNSDDDKINKKRKIEKDSLVISKNVRIATRSTIVSPTDRSSEDKTKKEKAEKKIEITPCSVEAKVIVVSYFIKI